MSVVYMVKDDLGEVYAMKEIEKMVLLGNHKKVEEINEELEIMQAISEA